ncbi:MAG: N-6 DNA methylase [Deltaproteobacteria bacterium]|nr:N-6 DNA methylase [Deltaproteobacteria bacterium]
MTKALSTSVEIQLNTYAQEVTAKFALPIDFNPEDQLKTPTDTLFRGIGAALDLEVKVVTEVQTDQLGRPDMGIAVKGLLAGHVELKAPGKGGDPDKLKGDDKRQWERFKNLPNLIYTDGNEWALYRSGQRVGKIVRLSGDVTTEGQAAIRPTDAEGILALMQDFLRWSPIVPASPTALAKMLAPLCRLLRADVLTALQNSESNLSHLAADWRKYLFPDADDFQFADAYAQTLTYALLLARLSGPGAGLSIPQAVAAIRTGHRLLADALKILGDPMAREEIETPVSVLERVIGAVDPAALTRKAKGDPWLYFYEDFLAAYDPKMRKDRGVYYTPVEVVQAQVRLVAQLLEERFDADFSFVNEKVITLDPGAGTGTYILAALQHGLQRVEQEKGPGMRANFATQAAQNLHAFELLVGPYAVAHLRLTQQILAEGGEMPADGVHVYLTDTLDSPYQPPPQYDMLYKELGEEYKRAQRVKADVPVLVVIGNPPYDRQQIEADEAGLVRRKGGWVRFSEAGTEGAVGFPFPRFPFFASAGMAPGCGRAWPWLAKGDEPIPQGR